jgi:arylsulfatase A-like enzyme
MLRGNSKFRHVDRGSYMKDHLPDGVRKRVVGAYRDAVRSVDRFTGELTRALDDDPVLLFHGDHGEGLGEHDSYGHQNVLYEENIHVPLLVADTAADSTTERADVTEPVSLRSLPDLIESLSKNEGVRADLPDGPTLSRTWSADTVALRDTRWKCLLTGSETELYDLDADPGERTDVTAEHPDLADRLTDRLEEFRDGLGDADVGEASEGITLSGDAEERLRTLGYRN